MPELNRRQQFLWRLFDFGSGRGLEVGPLHNTTVPREMADVSYLDVYDREGLQRTYASQPRVDTDLIPEIDFPLWDGERVRSVPEAIGDAARFDWVMASHVVEHVPDLIGWLQQLAEVVVDGGHLVLAVPDRRYCFDLHRPGTTVGQLLEAHERGDVVPSVRAVFDYKRGHANVNTPELWKGQFSGYDQRIHGLDEVVRQVDRARQGEYVDAHVWTFTPGSFAEQLVELRNLGLSEWCFETWRPTRPNALEFYVVLRRLPRAGWGPEDVADEPVPALTMPDWLADDAERRASLREVKARAAEHRRAVRRLRGRLRKRDAQVRRLRRELRRTRRELDAVRGSRQWRLGAALLRPVRALRRG